MTKTVFIIGVLVEVEEYKYPDNWTGLETTVTQNIHMHFFLLSLQEGPE